MQYQILNYDTDRLVATVKIAQDNQEFEFAPIFAISTAHLTSIEQLETAIFQTYQNNLPPRQRATVTETVENHLLENLNSAQPFSIDTQALSQLQDSNWDTAANSTTTTTATVI